MDVTKAERIVMNVNAQVDSVLKGLGYQIPVTGTQSIELLKDIVVQGSIAQILKAMFYGIKNPDDVGANEAWREFTGKLKALVDPDNPMTLPDAVVIDVAVKDTAEISSGFTYSMEEGDYFQPTRNQVF